MVTCFSIYAGPDVDFGTLRFGEEVLRQHPPAHALAQQQQEQGEQPPPPLEGAAGEGAAGEAAPARKLDRLWVDVWHEVEKVVVDGVETADVVWEGTKVRGSFSRWARHHLLAGKERRAGHLHSTVCACHVRLPDVCAHRW